MLVSPITHIPASTPGNGGIVPPWLTHPGNGGIVPPWLEKDLGHEATHPTTHPSWRADFSR